MDSKSFIFLIKCSYNTNIEDFVYTTKLTTEFDFIYIYI